MRLLHVLGPAPDAGTRARVHGLVAGWDGGIAHAVATPDAQTVADIPRVTPHRDPLPLGGPPLPGRLQRIARALAGYDLILSYGWGAIDAAMAHTVFGQALALPALIHHELVPDPAAAPAWWRRWYRRIALGRSAALIAADDTIATCALGAWQQPPARVHAVPLGIDLRAFAARPARTALPRLIKRGGELWLGALAPLDTDTEIPPLLDALGRLPEEWQLVVIGAQPDAEALRAAALARGLSHRLHLAGAVSGRAAALGLLDLLTLGPDADEVTVLSAMAAGLPLAAPRASPAGALVAPEGRRLATLSAGGLASSLVELCTATTLRQSLGAANRLRAQAMHDRTAMCARTAAICAAAIGRPLV